MIRNNQYPNFTTLFWQNPQAWANVEGSGDYPEISGRVRFYQTGYGVVVVAEIEGLPNPRGRCESPIFGFHIHEGDRCAGNASDPFAEAKGHYNPRGCPHPYHAGDLPPLFGAEGYAFSVFLTKRFTVREIVGRTVVIHGHLDDFTSQPSGDSGMRIACGQIRN